MKASTIPRMATSPEILAMVADGRREGGGREEELVCLHKS